MKKFKLKPPRALKGRIKAVAKAHKFDSAEAVVEHFLTRGLKAYGVECTVDEIGEALDRTVDDQGYSSVDELVEHLLLRGLNAYEQVDDDPAALERRLRGLGYID